MMPIPTQRPSTAGLQVSAGGLMIPSGATFWLRHASQSRQRNATTKHSEAVPVAPQQQQHLAPQAQPVAAQRRLLLSAAAAALLLTLPQATAPCQARPGAPDPALVKAFQAAMSAEGFEAKDAAWTRAIQLAPDNAAAWSNRGTVRQQEGRWQEAYEDLQRSFELEVAQRPDGQASPALLNALGNAEGALGKWDAAMQHYKAASEDDEMGPIAGANYALAAFETGKEREAVAAARQLLRRDPEFSDMRAALAAFLWASGQSSAAEDAWESLQQAQGGLGAALYSKATAVARVRGRWPPRATAALDAFLGLSDVGRAQGYDMRMYEYVFSSATVEGARGQRG